MNPRPYLSCSLLLAVGGLLLGGLLLPGSPASASSSAEPVLLPVANEPTVSFSFWFRVGSQDDPPGKEGLAFLTGSLLAEGATQDHSYPEILQALFPMATSYGGQVGYEMSNFSGTVHVDFLAPYLDLITAAVVRPKFDPADFERLRTDLKNSIEKGLRYSSDEELGKAALMNFVYAGTPYGHIPPGTVESLDAITLDDVKAFYKGHYTRDNVTFGLGGGYPASLIDQVRTRLAALPEGTPAAVAAPQPAAILGRQVLLVAKPDADSSISIGVPIPVRRGERDFYALWLANSWLGEHRNSASHLYQVIREARGLNYGDYSYIEAFPQGGFRSVPPANVGRRSQMFEVWIRTLPNDHALFALRAALREIDALVANGLTEEQFQLTKSFLSKYVLHFADNTGGRLEYAIDDRFYGITGDGHLQRFRSTIASLTRDEVNAAIKKYLSTANLKIAIVTGTADKLKADLVSGSATPITYPSEKPPAVLDEDKIIAAYPFGIRAEDVKIVPIAEMFQK